MAKILVIDDDAEIREMTCVVLEGEGHNVFQAEDGILGFRMIDINNFDLIILDLVMPNQDGLKTIIQIKSKYPAMKIIVISGEERINSKNYLFFKDLYWVDKTLSKPFALSELILSVNELL